MFIEKYVYTKFHLDWYCNVWPEAVLQELQCLPNCLHTYLVKIRGRYHITKIRCSIHFPVSEIAKCIAWGYLLFYNNYIVYRIVYMFVWSEFEVAITSPSFVALILLVSEIAKYVYSLRLFIIVLQELHCLLNCLHVCIIRVRGAITSPSFVTLLLLVSEIAKYIAWGCLLLFYKNYIVYWIVYMFVWSELEVLSLHQVSLLYSFWFLR